MQSTTESALNNQPNRDQSFGFHVLHYLPGATGAELENRIALLKARDWGAALRGRTDSPLAQDLAITAHEVAGHFAFAPDEPKNRLGMAADLCRRLAGAALAADSLAATDHPGLRPTLPAMGGADGSR